MPIAESIIAGLATTAVTRLAGQIAVSASGLRGKDKARELEASQLLASIDFVSSPLRAAVSLPSEIDDEDVIGLVESPYGQASLYELLMAILTNAPAQTIAEARERWILNNPSAVIDSVASGLIFDILVKQYILACDTLRKEFPDTYARLHDEAQYVRIACILENMQRQESSTGLESLSEIVRRYRDQVKKAHRYLTPPDFERRRYIPVEDLYVAPTMHDSLDPEIKVPFKSLDTIVDRTVLLGDPGIGKSTASQVMTYCIARQERAAVPFLVVLRDFASSRPSMSVIEYLEQHTRTFYQSGIPVSILEYLLRTGQSFVIFDGLDELLETSARREVTDTINNFCNAYPTSRVLVTSRRVGYLQAPMDPRQFRVIELSEFDDAQVADYVTKWFRLDDQVDGDPSVWASSFVSESSGVSDLRANPLLLSLMCILYRGERSIPKNRPAVYEQCAEMLFRKWDSHRGIRTELQAAGVVDAAMKHLAYWIFRSQDATDGVTESSLISETTRYLHRRVAEDVGSAELAAREFIEFCRGRAWVFTDVGTTGDGEALYKFTHRTFLEYFAAFHLVRLADSPEILAGRLLPRVANEEWDVVGQLSTQIIDKRSDRGADRVFLHMLGDKHKRRPEARSQILAFLSRCLVFAQIAPSTIRTLTNAAISSIRILPSEDVLKTLGGILLAAESVNGSVVAAELERCLRQLIESPDGGDRLFGLRLACVASAGINIASPASARSEDAARGWEVFFEGVLENYKEEFGKTSDAYLRSFAAVRGWITLVEFFEGAPHIDRLFEPTQSGIGSVGFIGIAYSIVPALLSGNIRWANECRRQVKELGRLVEAGKLDLRSIVPKPHKHYLDTESDGAGVAVSGLEVLGLGTILVPLMAGHVVTDISGPPSKTKTAAWTSVGWFAGWAAERLAGGIAYPDLATVFVSEWRAGVFDSVASAGQRSLKNTETTQ